MNKTSKSLRFWALLLIAGAANQIPLIGALISGVAFGLLFHLANKYWIRRVGTYIIAVPVTAYAGTILNVLTGAENLGLILMYPVLLALVGQDIYRAIRKRNSIEEPTPTLKADPAKARSWRPADMVLMSISGALLLLLIGGLVFIKLNSL